MSGTVGDNFFRSSGVVATAAEEYDDDQIQSNIAMLGFYVAVNGSLVRYNLVDQSIDEFFDTSGVDASASTNEERTASGSNYYYSGGVTTTPTITEDADSTGTDGDYSWYKWTDTGSTGSYSTDTTQDHEYLIVAGGGGAGGSVAGGGSGGGGAGGYRVATDLSLVGSTTYTITIGAGGAGGAIGQNNGVVGSPSSLTGSDITDVNSSGGGYGGSVSTFGGGSDGGAGGSGGGGGGATTGATGSSGGAGNAGTYSPAEGTAGGGVTVGTGNGATGGGHTAAGTNGTATVGGAGTSNDITGSSVTYATGGGAGNNQPGAAGAVNTGTGGSGSGQNYAGGNGGSGIVILSRLTSSTVIADLTLQSTDVTALSAPTYGEFVTLIENAAGTATLNTDIKGYVSRDSGTTFTQGTLVDEGTWGTDKKILAFHDLDISGQPSSTSMCYKITTHNQSASKETRIYATSIGWR